MLNLGITTIYVISMPTALIQSYDKDTEELNEKFNTGCNRIKIM